MMMPTWIPLRLTRQGHFHLTQQVVGIFSRIRARSSVGERRRVRERRRDRAKRSKGPGSGKESIHVHTISISQLLGYYSERFWKADF